MRRTKIVCTLGPSAESYGTIKKMVRAGMNVARINLSHGTHEEHLRRIEIVRQVREEMDISVAVMADTKGPEIRIRTFADGRVTLCDGERFTLTTRETAGDETIVSVTYPGLPAAVRPGQSILLNDGLIELAVEQTDKTDIVCRVVCGGVLTNSKSLNLPDCNIDMPYMSKADREDILFAVREDVEYLAISFVRTADDVKMVRQFLVANGGEAIQIIAKIENRSGVEHIEEILEQADGIMVARGDMGVEIPFEELPAIQKRLISRCYSRGKKVITATQMLESMIVSPRPTRAEISDVANAIYDGTSAIMLSGETAAGKYPVETVKTMAKIAEKTESDINFYKRFHNSDVVISTVTDAVSHATCLSAFELKAKAIITVSQSGYTTRKVSRFRPACVIIGATVSRKVYHQLALNWGVVPVLAVMQQSTDALFEHAVHCAKSTGLVGPGDLVVIAGGSVVGNPGNSNVMRIEVIG